MTLLTYSHGLVAGTPENVNHVQEMFDDAKTVINGNLDTDNLSASADIAATQLASDVGEPVGINQTGVVRRGKSIIATEETRTNASFGLLTTPDRVSNVVIPPDGLIVVVFQAMMKNTVATNGRAAIFLGANQLKVAVNSGVPVVQEANTTSDITYGNLVSCASGLIHTGGSSDTGSHVTTGQSISLADDLQGGPCHIFAAAGSYTVSVQFRAVTGTVSVKERKLWVWTMGF